MTTQDFQKKLITYIENNFNSNIKLENIDVPPQGMSSSVFFIKLKNGTECAVKYGNDAMKDIPALDLISEKQIRIPVPVPVASFVFDGTPVIILKRIQFPLFESVSVEEMPYYVPSIVKNLNELHKIKNDKPGRLGEEYNGETWKDILLSIFDGRDFDWVEVAKRESLNNELILSSVDNIIKKIEATTFDLKEYHLLHTDFNQRNLFVDFLTHEISGIIDWEDAMFGDPLYDFARVRMYMWHFNFSKKSIDDYYGLVNFSATQKSLEDLYWLSRVIQYIGWYSEELTEFNLSRIKLHQEYLSNYIW